MDVRPLPADSKPVQIFEKLDIARKPKVAAAPISNGVKNGDADLAAAGSKRKRSLEETSAEATEHTPKRGKMQMNYKANGYHGDDTVVIDDSNDGAIVIDDD